MQRGRAQVNTRWETTFKKHMRLGGESQTFSLFSFKLASSVPASSRTVARRVRRRRRHPVLSSSRCRRHARTARARIARRPSSAVPADARARARLRCPARPIRRLAVRERRATALLRVEVRVGRPAVRHRRHAGGASSVRRPTGREVRDASTASHARRVGDLEGVDLPRARGSERAGDRQ